MQRTFLLITHILPFILLIISCSRQDKSVFSELSGPYLGQKPPGMKAELFAPGIISTSLDEGNLCFSADGEKIYFSYMTPQGPLREMMLMYSKMEKTDGPFRGNLPSIKAENSIINSSIPTDRSFFIPDKEKGEPA